MKKLALSALAVATLATASQARQLYVDEDGQLFTKPAKDRKALKNDTVLFAKANKLKFSVQTFIGYKYNDYKKDTQEVDYKDDTSQFEARRAYFQVKAYLLDDPKSYYRVTFDAHNDNGSMDLRMKYAYLYLNNILPSTGVEVGLAHRPWHDYEQHNAWYYRSIAKVFLEDKNTAHLSNSADLGVMAKTRTKYFDSDIGVFNGEGYHETQVKKGLSFEWRATAHILGVRGKDKQTKKTYFDASFFGQINKDHKEVGDRVDDLVFYGLHTVYNQPAFLLCAQYIISEDTADNSSYVSAQAGSGYSLNGEFRFGGKYEYKVLGRYDSWTPNLHNDAEEKEQRDYIAGFAWKQNKNLEWVGNVTLTDNEKGSNLESNNGIAYMVTAEVKF